LYPSILIVVPVLNEAKNITRVVNELIVCGASLETEYKLIIVDGGSKDETVPLVERLCVKFPNLRLIHNPKKIQGPAVNLAVKKFGKEMDILIRCDSHASYPSHFVKKLVDVLAHVNADSVVIAMDSVGESCRQKAIAWISDSRVGSGGAAHRGGFTSGFVDHGHHAAFRLESFIKIEGYEESFAHSEDAEFDCRLRAAGGRIFLDASIRVSYMPRDTFSALLRQYFYYGIGRSRTMRRHPFSTRARQIFVPLHTVIFWTNITFGIIWPILWTLPTIYLTILLIISIMISVNKKSICGLLSGPAAFIMHTGWGCGFLYGFTSKR
jgi:succinoglycan biosynthesis protein ExoA